MKNLANCKPTEFLRQTNKIRHYVQKWFDITDIPNIRKKLPTIPDDATEEEKERLIEEQSIKNFYEMLDAAFESHPEETVGVLGLACFVPIEEADDHPMDFYFQSISEILSSEGALNFFISLVKLGLRNGT